MRYLTKSRFKLALECPAKLFYTGNKEYPDKKKEDDFLAALAEGGFQVGELAKLYYPGGVEIISDNHDESVLETTGLLANDSVVIFEAAFRHKNLFIRADIIVKNGNNIDLIEVKSKSFEGDDIGKMLGAGGGLMSAWRPYLYDVAFQKHVIMSAFPGFRVKAHLMLADKDTKATVDGLNQKFIICRDKENKVYVVTHGETTLDALGGKILRKINVDQIADGIISDSYGEIEPGKDFATVVKKYADNYENDQIINTPVGAQCSKCEFDCSFEDEQKGLKSGYRSCWRRQLNWTDDQFRDPHIFEIWNFRRKQNLIEEKVYHLKDVTKNHIGDFKLSKDGKMSTNERQWLQIEMTRENSREPHLDHDGMRHEMAKWNYPLHFIDFETNRVAVPFYRNRRPYEGIAFQFSHHTVDTNGLVKHAGEFINVEPGFFPNFEFIRALKKELEKDNGTIFRYADHENSFLVEIWRQLGEETDASVPDRRALMDFIKTITHSGADATEKWIGERDMVDMLKLVKYYFYHIGMKGSNSIKVVLPAVLETSTFVKEKYSQPVYGVQGGIESRNFKNHVWYKPDDGGKVINPYKLLGTVFNDMTPDEIKDFTVDDTIASGGAAMTAYARMQFSLMGDEERKLAKEALLRNCELDTMAMVMIYEYWKDRVNS